MEKAVKYDFASCAAGDEGEKEIFIYFKFEILYSCMEVPLAAQRLLWPLRKLVWPPRGPNSLLLKPLDQTQKGC